MLVIAKLSAAALYQAKKRLGLKGLEEPEGGGEVTLGREEGQREEGREADPGRGTRGRAPVLGSLRKGKEDWVEHQPEGRGARGPLGDPGRDQLTSERGGGCPSRCDWKIRLPGLLSPACPCGSRPDEPSAATRRSSRSTPVPPPAGCPRPPSARPGRRARS